MSLKVITFQREETYIRKFVAFPDNLYIKSESTQDKRTEMALLQGRHCLSKDVEVWGALALTEQGEPLARCMISYYEGGEEAFFGFFECTKNHEVCHRLMEAVKKHAAQRGRKRVVGPVDVSYWIRYGLKTNHFEAPYAGEPYNKDYYQAFLEAEGFAVAKRFVSNRYRIMDAVGADAALSEDPAKNPSSQGQSGSAYARGYEVRDLSKRDFGKSLRELYGLSAAFYKEFPDCRPITERQFMTLFSFTKRVLDFGMTKLAYKGDKPVGFLMALPNYGNLLWRTATPMERTRIQSIRRKPKEYVLFGLGEDTALSAAMGEELRKRLCRFVSAPKPPEKITENCLSEFIDDTYEYVLLTAPL